MTETFSHLGLGLTVALSLKNLALCFVGCLVGTLVGVLPGIGPLATIAILLPITFGLDPTGALIMLAGIYYGAQYGGSTTAILVNLPGEAGSAITALDGYQMARQGRAGVALGVAAIASFIAGTTATVAIAALGAPMASLALTFGPYEYFSLMLLGLVFAVVLSSGSVVKSITMVAIGILLAGIGVDQETGAARMTFGFDFLYQGIEFAVLAMGLFGIAEILRNLDDGDQQAHVHKFIGNLLPSRQDMSRVIAPITRGTLIGGILGILPGSGATLGSFASYVTEKRISKEPERFGKGAIEGVAGPEAANNAGAQTSFIPLLTLGIPPNAVMAMMIGAMTIHGIIPGPQVMSRNPDLFWGMIVSMWLGNLMLLIINLPMVGLWVRLLRVPYRLLFPSILMFCCIGIYSISNSPIDVMLLAVFGLFGYFLMRAGFEPAPLLLGFVLGRLIEENFRRAMVISHGDFSGFFDRPLSALLLLTAAALLLLTSIPGFRRRRKKAFAE